MFKATSPRDEFLLQISNLGFSPEQVAAMLGQFDQEGNAPKNLSDAIEHEVGIITGRKPKNSISAEIVR